MIKRMLALVDSDSQVIAVVSPSISTQDMEHKVYTHLIDWFSKDYCLKVEFDERYCTFAAFFEDGTALDVAESQWVDVEFEEFEK